MLASCANLVTVKDATARLLDPNAAKGVVACQKQVDAAGAKLVDGVLKDEKTTSGVNAQTFCLVKSA